MDPVAWELAALFEEKAAAITASALAYPPMVITIPLQQHAAAQIKLDNVVATPKADTLQPTELTSEDLRLVAAAFATPCIPDPCSAVVPQQAQHDFPHYNGNILHMGITSSPGFMPQTTQKRYDYQIREAQHTQQQAWGPPVVYNGVPPAAATAAGGAGAGGVMYSFPGLRNTSTQSESCETFCMRFNAGMTTSLFGIDEELQQLLGGGGGSGGQGKNGSEIHQDTNMHGASNGGTDLGGLRGTGGLFSPGYGLSGLPF